MDFELAHSKLCVKVYSIAWFWCVTFSFPDESAHCRCVMTGDNPAHNNNNDKRCVCRRQERLRGFSTSSNNQYIYIYIDISKLIFPPQPRNLISFGRHPVQRPPVHLAKFPLVAACKSRIDRPGSIGSTKIVSNKPANVVKGKFALAARSQKSQPLRNPKHP